MTDLNAFDYVAPVWTGPDRLDPTEFVGTAFSIGGGYFLTAGHVVTAALAAPHHGLATTPDGRELRGSKINESQVFSSHDVAIFQSDASQLRAFQWFDHGLALGTGVRSVGFPFAVDLHHGEVAIRLFAGHVVRSIPSWRTLPASPPAYELSFRNPRGLSGAPLLTTDADAAVLVGIIIGNASAEMEVFRQREQTTVKVAGVEREREEVYTRVEALELGIAIQSSALLELRPEMLAGRSVREHLAANGLLRPWIPGLARSR